MDPQLLYTKSGLAFHQDFEERPKIQAVAKAKPQGRGFQKRRRMAGPAHQRRKERNTPTGSVLARPQRIGYSCHGDLAGANDRTALRNDRSGLLELEALQSQLDAKISQVLEEDSRELPAMPVRPATPGLPAPSTRSSAPCALNLSVPNPPAAGLEGAPATDLASSHWFKELQASWAAGAAAAKPPVSAPGTGDLKEVTMEPVAEPLTKTSGLEGLVLTPTYFHFRSDE
eukprot:symbB.v1.2.033435.t1/scaffold4152.1/size43796/2